MSFPNITETADKVAVVETLYRYAAGIDLRDENLIASAFTEGAVSDFRPAAAKAGFDYPVLEGRQNIITALSGALAKIDTTHSVSNPRVDIDGDNAHLEAIVEAQHVSQSDSTHQYMMKNRYNVDLVKQAGVWLIQHVTVDNVWRMGDRAVLAGV